MEVFTFFWKSKSPFSQWYISLFKADNIEFNCTEQFMMYKKAELFRDKEIMKAVLLEKDPSEHKKLGRKVKDFDKKVWEENCQDIVYEGNFFKFTQNAKLLEELMSTRGTTLVEASPFDKIWGIGMTADHLDASNRSRWKGTNWLGEVLTSLRNALDKG
jgi:ribA/ribD-fused uncharacterized protein